MSARSPVRLYCASVFALATVLVALAAPRAHLEWILHDPLRFVALSAGVLLGEMLPIKIPRRGDDEELTLSAAFALALLLVGGLGPAIIAQGVSSIVQDRRSGKPAWRVRFNVGQYALSTVAAWLVVRAIAVNPRLELTHPFSSGQLPAMLVGAVAFFIVNAAIVGPALALHQGVPIRSAFNNISLIVTSGAVIVLAAPIVLAAATYSVWIVPLCFAPVVAMYSSISQSARSEHLALHDSLTGLPNRMAFHAAAAAAVGDGRTTGYVLLLDLDRFKEVNDTLGHRYGDLLLVELASRFRAVVGDHGDIARLGGDEFALVSAGGSREQAFELARRIVDALGEPVQLEELVVDAQASVGIALFPEHGSAVETLLQKADVAMYRAKETRRDVELYDERHDHHSPAKLALTGELRSALAEDQIAVWYQPQLDLRTGRILGVEALVRWEHPRLGHLLPGEFVRIAEQSNLIEPLTRRVIAHSLTQVAQWRALGLQTAVAVNISPQVLISKSFTEEIMGALQRVDVPPTCLRLEVTEGALMSDPLTAHDVLRELDGLGVEISIDDFGTGYSSLAYLADLPVSEVKIDRSFVSRMTDSASERIIVNSTIDLAHHLGMRAVAEGVEHPSLLAELDTLGCDAIQGYAVSPPLETPEATAWLLGHARSAVDPAAPDDAGSERAIGLRSVA